MMFGLGVKSKMSAIYRELRYFVENRFRRPDLYDLSRPERIGAIYMHPSDMCETDRLMLYALVRGLRPQKAIEIGVRWGNSAKIITNAMEENGEGALVGIDPETSAFRIKASDLHDRYVLLKGFSPEIIPRAVEMLGGQTDFVFVDALHTHDAVKADFLGVLPYLSTGAHILFHDTYHQGICRGIDEVLKNNSNLNDLGFVTRNPEIGNLVSYQGLRLVRFGNVSGTSLIEEAYTRLGHDKPVFHKALNNYDDFANRIGKGATEEEILAVEEVLANQGLQRASNSSGVSEISNG